MKLKFPKFFKNKSSDFILRIYAVILAVLIWFILSITLYPETTKTINNIPVTIDVSGTSAETNKLSPVNFGELSVDVRIKGKRIEIGNYSKDDLIAEVSVTGVTTSGEYPLSINVYPKNGKSCEILSISPSTVNVKFDSIIEKEFIVTPSAENVKAAIGYIRQPLVCSPSTIKIKGPKSDVERIDKVVARTDTVNVVSEPQSIQSDEFVLYDGYTVLDKTPFTFSQENFSIDIPIYMKKTLPFKIEIQNYPRNFDLLSLSYSLSNGTIDVSAPKSILEDRDEYHLGYIDISKIDLNNFTFDFPIDPEDEGYNNLSGINTVTVTFDTDGLASKNVSILNSQIHVINAPSRYDVKVLSTGISNIKIIGPEEIISELTSADIIAEIDFLSVDINESTYSVPVKIYSPEYNTVWSFDSYNVAVNVTEIAD
ncbi:MAG: hypothetical protein WC900_03115 [Oscillospiraceae bacterium]|jgi:YbbR domain-containing protein